MTLSGWFVGHTPVCVPFQILYALRFCSGTVPRDNVAPPLTDLSGSLIVRNLNFQTTKEDLFSLCKPFGLIRSLRLVKRKTELSENSNKDAEPSQHRQYVLLHRC